MSELLRVEGLHIAVEGKEILKGLDLTITQAKHMSSGFQRRRQIDAVQCHHGQPEIRRHSRQDLL